ncbi:preprotein translocase subunit SecG [Mucilaginibacter myungsuensis]|uniref:Protein-export membrane protein SecG n=1 Tax=Mucilaginibacter myungsuensis TaxID=649104 RepID=A0A929KYE0_9SPHI|nr:preprotein translocase subunit SecG [Mucilaginibacter myungsuensis]MBE9663432.1 preprotein translocase subunit SecG [Mucilaginibacter myungsuensis]MDN3600170.1 preprotein translocase subunit SecG [Mucilaginibacter myungsuensis]
MFYILLVIAILVCVLLGAIVLIQNPKGGGLASNFSASSQLMGVQKTGDFLEKGTWFLAIALMVLSLGINVVVKGVSSGTDNSADDALIEKVSKPSTTTTPAATPVLPGAGAAKPADTAKK